MFYLNVCYIVLTSLQTTLPSEIYLTWRHGWNSNKGHTKHHACYTISDNYIFFKKWHSMTFSIISIFESNNVCKEFFGGGDLSSHSIAQSHWNLQSCIKVKSTAYDRVIEIISDPNQNPKEYWQNYCSKWCSFNFMGACLESHPD